jgi:hypothetical protein
LQGKVLQVCEQVRRTAARCREKGENPLWQVGLLLAVQAHNQVMALAELLL